MFDDKRIKNNLEEISFPRRFGTDDERKAVELLKQKIQGLGLKYEVQSFKFTNFYSSIIVKVSVLVLMCVLLLEFRGTANEIVFPIIPIVLTFSFVMYFLSRIPDKFLIGKKLKSQNLIVELNPSNGIGDIKTDQKEIIFMAHVDSKGQTVSIRVRVYSYEIWIISTILLSVVIFLRFIFHENYFWDYHQIATILMIVNYISGFLILINFSNNKSFGALDDGSGIVILLELLNYFRDPKLHPKNYKIEFLFTGAEECGTMGIRRFLRSIKSSDKNNYLFVNFDGIGTRIDMLKIGRKNQNTNEISELFTKIGSEKNLPINRKKVLLGVHTDAWQSSKRGYKVLDFGDSEVYNFLHSENDTPDKISCKTLEKFCRVVSLAVKEIDKHQLL